MRHPSFSISRLQATPRSLKPGTVRRTTSKRSPKPGHELELADGLGTHVVAGEHGVDHADPIHEVSLEEPLGEPSRPAPISGDSTAAPPRVGAGPMWARLLSMQGSATGAFDAAHGARPERVVVVCGTGTEVGKTWVAAAVLASAAGGGCRWPPENRSNRSTPTAWGIVCGASDAEVLAAASGDDAEAVCHPHRSFHRAMAPPMAAEALGLPPFTVGDLVAELRWPFEPVDLGVVEPAGGVRSPLAADGDTTDLVARLRPDAVVLVADAGLGTINAVRLSTAALAGVTGVTGSDPTVPVHVVLDRFDARHEIHRRNREWLTRRDGHRVFVLPGEEAELTDALVETPRPAVSEGR